MLETILIVEDSPEDLETAVRALRADGRPYPIVHCPDGDEALDYLFRRGAYTSRTPDNPAIVLLDLNLPGTDGREVLEEMKADAELCRVPVIVLTTSTDERDVEGCYRAGANSFVYKPVDLDRFLHTIQRLKEYWMQINLLPPLQA